MVNIRNIHYLILEICLIGKHIKIIKVCGGHSLSDEPGSRAIIDT